MGIDMMRRKDGDIIQISGDYQYRALKDGNPVQRFWHYSKQLAIQRHLPPGSEDYVLDVGCGSGVITAFLGSRTRHAIGMDNNRDAIAYAQRMFGASNVEFVYGQVDQEIEFERPFNKIYCLELIEHIYMEQGLIMLKNFHRILKSGGKVFITTPNYLSLWPIIEWSMDRLKLIPTLAELQHVEHYDAKKLSRLCIESGFDLDGIYTTCFLAPWAAAVNWELAKKINSIDDELPMHLGSVLIAVLCKE
jgi:2-polyprenyl-3-methyl-5-hydroxy-6-metoxy-1,4-benzoquinol methylase